MQGFDWDDLKFALALHRTGRMARAARALGVNETTAARRVRALEHALGAALFLRDQSGTYVATDIGLTIIDHAETIEHEHHQILEQVCETAQRISGTVRLSAVPLIANRFLVPHLPALFAQHPELTVELLPSASNLDLTRREADLAIRLAMPSDGGLATKAQKLATLSFAAYTSTTPPNQTRWITYDDAHSSLPQARWIATTLARSNDSIAPLRVADAETALEAVAAGVGAALLPTCVADNDPRLSLLPFTDAPLLTRDAWLLSHTRDDTRASIGAVKDWLGGRPWG
ncbi:LysR family transcriptional regulator [Shimia abyssi]|uniref:LysR family transcriptional regulator n=1 Tax=Shimia abyssi TaxID=1662395 RepID=A0A2P8FB44_9RHOB|nr:LysR family transcriptional regulator [Shimia abyssi]PSL18950.1 LysR family transcriptional regulator [Shimia abyssi]